MRIYSALSLVVVLAACGQEPPPPAPQAKEDAERIECALGPGSTYGPDCLVEQAEGDGSSYLIVRHPDGSFRRFERKEDGTGLVTADGAFDAEISYSDGKAVVKVADDRYIFPATGHDGVPPAPENTTVGDVPDSEGDAAAE